MLKYVQPLAAFGLSMVWDTIAPDTSKPWVVDTFALDMRRASTMRMEVRPGNRDLELTLAYDGDIKEALIWENKLADVLTGLRRLLTDSTVYFRAREWPPDKEPGVLSKAVYVNIYRRPRDINLSFYDGRCGDNYYCVVPFMFPPILMDLTLRLPEEPEL